MSFSGGGGSRRSLGGASTNSRGSRRDDLSLSYSIDESMSRASTFISAVSSEGNSSGRISMGEDYPPQYPQETQQYPPEQYHEEPNPQQYLEEPQQYAPESQQYYEEQQQYPPESQQYYEEQQQYPPEEQQYPPQAEPAQEETSYLGSMLKGPMEYIFGEEDEVSTLGGGYNQSEARDWDGDNSTIATTPTMRIDLSMQHQPTIYEDEEEYEDEEYVEDGGYHPDQQLQPISEEDLTDSFAGGENQGAYQDEYQSTHSRDMSHARSISPLTLVKGEFDTVGKSDEATYEESNEEEASQMDNTRSGAISEVTNDPYFQQRSAERMTGGLKSIAEDASMREEDFEEESYVSYPEKPSQEPADDKSFVSMQSEAMSRASNYTKDSSPYSVYSDSKSQHSRYSDSGSVQSSQSDLKSRKSYYSDAKSVGSSYSYRSGYDDDASQAGKSFRGDASVYSHQSDYSSSQYSVSTRGSAMLEKKHRDELSKAETTTSKSSRSDMWRRNIASNKSWRSAKSLSQSYRHPLYSSRSLGSHHTNMTLGSVMPDTPEIVREGDGTRPMMTRGMSGRAVIHVELNSTNDGIIEDLCYTHPLMESENPDTVEEFDDELPYSEKHKKNPHFDSYYKKHGVIRFFYGKRCYRLMAILGVVFSIALAVFMSLIAHVDELTTGANHYRNNEKDVGFSLDDVKKPVSFKGSHFTGSSTDKHIADWFNERGNYWLSSKGVPLVLDIPMSGSYGLERSWGECLGRTIASNKGQEVENTITEENIFGINYIIVDLSNRHGIKHAARLDLVPSGLPDLLITPLFQDAVEALYSTQHKAKLVVTLRDPIQRSLAMYEYMKKGIPEVAGLTLEEYAQSKYIENNYVIRLLTGKYSGSITETDVEFCKELLRRKAIVGLYENIEKSFKHYEEYLGWLPSTSHALNCQAGVIADIINTKPSIQVHDSSAAYALIRNQNNHDIALYNYVKNALVPYQKEILKRQKKMAQARESGGADGSISL